MEVCGECSRLDLSNYRVRYRTQDQDNDDQESFPASNPRIGQPNTHDLDYVVDYVPIEYNPGSYSDVSKPPRAGVDPTMNNLQFDGVSARYCNHQLTDDVPAHFTTKSQG